MQGNFTLFKSDSNSSAGGSADFVKDVFEDVSLKATTNQGLTDNASVNPLAQFVGNTDTPLYSNKTLFIKDLILIQDRSQWVKNRPTYIVEFTEPMPGIFAYVYGNVRLGNQNFGMCVDIRDIGDGFGVTGLNRSISWGFNVTQQTPASVQAFTDQVAGSTLNFNLAAPGLGGQSVNTWYYVKHQSALSTHDIHDYRIEANQYALLSVGSIQVYFENASANVEFRPGTTYIDKFKSTTSSPFGATLPIMAGKLGAETIGYKTQSNTYALSTSETPYISSIGTGASGSNLIDVSTGQGGSFPAGSGVVVVQGTSFYIGSVESVSTDTLTVTPLTPFGVSGLIYKAWQGGPTLPIGNTLYSIRKTVDVDIQNDILNSDGFIKSATGNYYYSDPAGMFRIWGKNLALSTIEGYPGLGFNGNTNSFIQLDFKGSALDCEVSANGILNGVFKINGTTSFILNEGITGVLKKTIMTDGGPGWNSFCFTPGLSLTSFQFNYFNIYDRFNNGQSLGILSTFETAIDKVYRYTHNASMMSLGAFQRVYGDNLYFNGDWVRGTTTTAAGNVYYAGATNSCVLNFNYFGNDFALIGSFGTSSVVLLDGASIGAIGGQLVKVAGTTFHTLEYQHKSGTCVIAAVDFSHPQTLELINEQNFLPLEELADIPQAFYQSDTPREARNGALWCKDQNSGLIYIRLANRWFQISSISSSDDPNAPSELFVRSHGGSAGGTYANGEQDVEHYNFTSWSSGTADTTKRVRPTEPGENGYRGFHYALDGINTSSALAAYHAKYNKISWAVLANRSTAKGASSAGTLVVRYVGKGDTGGPSVRNDVDAWNDVSWSNGVAGLNTAAGDAGCFVQGGKARWLGGYVSGAGQTDAHDTYNGTSTGTDTSVPQVTTETIGLRCGINGAHGITGGSRSAGTNSYKWDGTSWSSTITVTYGPDAETSVAAGSLGCGNGYSPNKSLSVINGGSSSTSVSINTSAQFNDTAWSSITSSTMSRAAPSGSVI